MRIAALTIAFAGIVVGDVSTAASRVRRAAVRLGAEDDPVGDVLQVVEKL